MNERFNELSVADLCKLNELVGMEFVISNGEVQGAYIPAERVR